jgi:hypothetical protein
MRTHFSSEQISRWMTGEPTPDEFQHIRECAQCAAETARLDSLLAGFRSSVVAWSALHKGAEAPERWKPLQQRGRVGRSALRWSMAAAALAIAAALPICKNLNDRRREAEAFSADARLWEEVNAQISRPVPSSLEPLMKLVVWEPDANPKWVSKQGETR